MAKVTVHVWHKVTGEIVAVGRPVGGTKCVPLGDGNKSAIETQIDEEHIPGLHKTHFVDIHRKLVVKQSDSSKKG